MASLKDLIVTGPARFLNKIYGNLVGNATSADKVNHTLTLQFNGTTSKTFNGSSDQTFNVTCAAIGAATVADAAKATDAEVTTMLDTLFDSAS